MEHNPMTILNVENLKELRNEIKEKYKSKISKFESTLINLINKTIKDKISLNNEGTVLTEQFKIKIDLVEAKFHINDLYEEILKTAKKIEEESEIIESISVKLENTKIRGKSFLDDKSRIIHSLAKDLPEIILDIVVVIKI